MNYFEESLKLHQMAKGKIRVTGKIPLKNQYDLSLAYTHGVTEPCRAIAGAAWETGGARI